MLDTLPLLQIDSSDFPSLHRGRLNTLQVNLGYLCNQSCVHCHVNAGPTRTELMDEATIDLLLEVLKAREINTLDVTGGAPEMNPHFRKLVVAARALGVTVIDRCNLTVLQEPGQEDLAEFLAHNRVEVTASLPCYSEANVDQQRGKGVFGRSIAALKTLNSLGYGKRDHLRLNLVYNPVGAHLTPAQGPLQAQYQEQLFNDFGIVFNELFTITNMPISRFGSILLSKGQYQDYMQLLRDNYSDANLEGVMCRTLLSVDWQGFLYDCDFNQMLGLDMTPTSNSRRHLRDLVQSDLQQQDIVTADHCYGCTAGQGSSCGGALG